MSDTTPRFPSLTPEAMTPEQREVVQAISSGPRGAVRGPFVALLHNPLLASRVQSLGEYLRYQTGVPDPLVELVVLITARHHSCQYEWYAHARLARQAGLAPAIIDAIAACQTPTGMSDDEALVHAFATETLAHGQPSDERFEAARARFGLERVLSLLALVGYYSMLAYVLNTARIPLPDGAAPPLPPR